MEILGLKDIIHRYDVFFLDMCGVILLPAPFDSGKTQLKGVPMAAIPGAYDALVYLKDQGKKVVLVTNAEDAASELREKIATWSVPKMHEKLDHIVTAGDVLRSHLAVYSQGPEPLSVYFWGNFRRGNKESGGLNIQTVSDLGSADIVLCTQSVLNVSKTTPYAMPQEDVSLMQKMLEQKLPMFVPNPDVSAPAGEDLVHLAPGFFAEKYEDLGGVVVRAGKPGAEIFDEAYKFVSGCDKSRIVMIGDTLHTDIQGAAEWGVDSVLLRSGNYGSGSRYHSDDGADPTWILDHLRE